MSEPPTTITVEIAYATPDKQVIVELEVAQGTTAKQAAIVSDINQQFPQIDFDNDPMGIFGNSLGSKGLAPAAEYVMNDGDRVEIYRPLIADPKEARKKRAEKKATTE